MPVAKNKVTLNVVS